MFIERTRIPALRLNIASQGSEIDVQLHVARDPPLLVRQFRSSYFIVNTGTVHDAVFTKRNFLSPNLQFLRRIFIQ